MNLSVLEEWIRSQRLPTTLLSCFDPVTQLLQLLQCLSQLQDWDTFSATVKEQTSLNALQIRRCVTHYRYEVDELKLPEEVDSKLAMMLNSGTSIAQPPKPKIDDYTDRISTDVESDRSNISVDIESIASKRLSGSGVFENEDEEMKERRDSRFILPFSLPAFAVEQQEGPSRADAVSVMSLRSTVSPSIPEDWMHLLDSI
jgi:hypothetical protein